MRSTSVCPRVDKRWRCLTHEETLLVEPNFSDRSSGWILVVVIRVGATLLVLVLLPACERVMTRRRLTRLMEDELAG